MPDLDLFAHESTCSLTTVRYCVTATFLVDVNKTWNFQWTKQWVRGLIGRDTLNIYIYCNLHVWFVCLTLSLLLCEDYQLFTKYSRVSYKWFEMVYTSWDVHYVHLSVINWYVLWNYSHVPWNTFLIHVPIALRVFKKTFLMSKLFSCNFNSNSK